MTSKVLIIDDDRITREGLEAILESDAYFIELASSGEEGIEKALSFSPDVILLDVMMAGMDGYEVCRRIRAIPSIAEVPILILTALDDQESMLRGLDAGADDFLSKPFNRHELRGRVGTITRLNRYRILLKERARIRELANRVINIQEEERRRIAQELHDEFGQALTTLGIGLKLLIDTLPVDPPDSRCRVEEMITVTQDLFTQLRLLGSELRPPALDTLGLAPALEGYCRDFSRRTGLPVRHSIPNDLLALPETYQITLYRFLQETLSNVVKHANASQAWVKLSAENGYRLSVQDDGRGFSNPNSGVISGPYPRLDGSVGFGILGMQERFDLLSGHLEIISEPGKGSRVTGWLPALLQGQND